jgi:DNA-binding transcriptional LysR family regulator
METIVWDDLRVLLAVHRTGSLLAAGKVLGISTSTTARRLDSLEAAAGRELLYRSRSGTELRPDALPMVRLAEGIANGLDTLRRDKQLLAGTLRVSVPDGLAQTLTRALMTFHEANPGVDIELVAENRMSDVAARESDIAVRLTRSTSNVLIEKQITSFRFSLFASTDYVRRHLPSRRLGKAEAAMQSFVGLDDRWRGLPHEQWMRALGARRFAFRSSSSEAIVEAVRQGAGISALLEKDLRNADLIRIEADTAGPTQPLFLVYHRELRKQTHVRAAAAAIEACLRALR